MGSSTEIADGMSREVIHALKLFASTASIAGRLGAQFKLHVRLRRGRMKLHKDRQVDLGNGATRFTTLCGRMNRRSSDGMNIANSDDEVTCKFCHRKMDNRLRQTRKMRLI
jgi:hypothetical protein